MSFSSKSVLDFRETLFTPRYLCHTALDYGVPVRVFPYQKAFCSGSSFSGLIPISFFPVLKKYSVGLCHLKERLPSQPGMLLGWVSDGDRGCFPLLPSPRTTPIMSTQILSKQVAFKVRLSTQLRPEACLDHLGQGSLPPNKLLKSVVFH